jgi:hypothetical protein
MVLVAGVRCSFAGEDAGSAHIQRYGRDRGRCQRASSAALRHRLYFAKPSSSRVGSTGVSLPPSRRYARAPGRAVTTSASSVPA